MPLIRKLLILVAMSVGLLMADHGPSLPPNPCDPCDVCGNSCNSCQGFDPWCWFTCGTICCSCPMS